MLSIEGENNSHTNSQYLTNELSHKSKTDYRSVGRSRSSRKRVLSHRIF